MKSFKFFIFSVSFLFAVLSQATMECDLLYGEDLGACFPGRVFVNKQKISIIGTNAQGIYEEGLLNNVAVNRLPMTDPANDLDLGFSYQLSYGGWTCLKREFHNIKGVVQNFIDFYIDSKTEISFSYQCERNLYE